MNSWVWALLLLASATQAFLVVPGPRGTLTSSRQATTRLAVVKHGGQEVSRGEALGALAVSLGLLALPIPRARAEIEDLSEPTPQEIEEARIKAKLKRQQEALQKSSATGSMRSYGEDLKKEKEKQKALKKSGKERRDDLCETLGRGC